MSTYDDASLIYYPSGYKAGKAYSLKPTDGSGDLDFTRASTATRVNESGLIESVAANVPRLDNSEGGCSSLLLEPQRTNLMFPSQDFNAWQLSSGATITSSTITSPSGANDAYEIQSTTVTSRVQKSLSITGTYTQSLFVKYAGTDTIINLRRNIVGDDLRIEVTSSGLTISNVGTSIISYSITEINNGWHKITATALNFSYFQIYIDVFDGNGSLYIWGAEVQEGSFSTSYIPTTTTAVTRVADVSATATSLFTNEGSIVVDLTEIGSQNTYVARVLQVYIDVNNVIQLTRLGTTYFFQVYNAGVLEVNISISSITTLHNKIGIAWKTNDCKIYINGVDKGTDTSCSLTFTPTYFGIATYFGGGTNYYANIHSVIAFPTRLSNAELATLTTI